MSAREIKSSRTKPSGSAMGTEAGTSCRKTSASTPTLPRPRSLPTASGATGVSRKICWHRCAVPFSAMPSSWKQDMIQNSCSRNYRESPPKSTPIPSMRSVPLIPRETSIPTRGASGKNSTRKLCRRKSNQPFPCLNFRS